MNDALDLADDVLIIAAWLLAAARLTRLLTKDEVTDGIRAWVYGHFGAESKAGYFVTCPWCVGLWVSAALAPVALHHADRWSWPAFAALALASSYVTGVLAANAEGEEDDIEVEVTDDTP